jgi:hypothetical protein
MKFGSFGEFLGIFKPLTEIKKNLKRENCLWAEYGPKPWRLWAGGPLRSPGKI